MAGIKGQKSGGFGGRKKLENPKNLQIRVTKDEKEIIQIIREKMLTMKILEDLKGE